MILSFKLFMSDIRSQVGHNDNNVHRKKGKWDDYFLVELSPTDVTDYSLMSIVGEVQFRLRGLQICIQFILWYEWSNLFIRSQKKMSMELYFKYRVVRKKLFQHMKFPEQNH